MPRTDLTVVLGDRFYAVERPWGQLPPGQELAFVSDVAIDSQGFIYLAQRSDPPIVVFDPAGAHHASWGADHIADAHGIFISPDDTLYITDRDAHQILIF